MILPNYILQSSTNVSLSTFNYSLQRRESWNIHSLPKNPPCSGAAGAGEGDDVQWGPQSQSGGLELELGSGPAPFKLTFQPHKNASLRTIKSLLTIALAASHTF